jgi:hypothetical protein
LYLEKSQVRHTSYCRKKSGHPLRVRKRSCLACIKAKTYCDALTLPCSRCSQKSITCIYDGSNVSAPIINRIDESTLNTQTEPVITHWGELNITNYLRLPTTSTLIPSKQMESSYLFSLPTEQPNWIGLSSGGFNVMTTMNEQPFDRGTRAFWSKGVKWRQLSLVRKWVLNNLRPYPSMMLSMHNKPPFVHHLSIAKESLESQPGPLSRCAGIMALWSTKNRNNKHYIWKIIRMEHERLSLECISYNDWHAVEAVQAVAIYFLLRVSVENDEDTDFDILLIQTMIKVTVRTSGFTVKYCNPASQHRPVWEQWVLVESLRRALSTIFIVQSLFDITPGLGNKECKGAKLWTEMLLPAAKELWQAQNQTQWEDAYQNSKRDRRPTFGELLRHDDLHGQACDLLNSWMGQVDDFGTLVIGAASLAE